MRLSTRLAIILIAFVVLTASAVGMLIYRNVVAISVPNALERNDTHARIVATEMETATARARADVLGFSAAVAVAEIVKARLDRDPAAAANEAQWRQRLASRFAAELAAKPDYAQFRVIGFADGGREIVRVDRAGPGNSIRIVPDEELQSKGDRGYFKEAANLKPGEVYVSPVDLNRERGIIETPYVPTLRTAAPIVEPDGKPFGMVVINFDLRPTFERIRWAERVGDDVYVMNERGDYLLHPDPRREFGFELGTPFRLQDDFPALAEVLKSTPQTPRIVERREGAQFGAGFGTAQLAGGPRVIVMQTSPYSQVVAAATAVRDSSLLGGTVAVICAVGLAIVFSRSLTGPLVQMTRAAEGLARGETMPVPTQAGGEIGVLARAFTRMADEMREKSEALRKENEERRQLFDTSLDLILITDTRGNFVRVSPSSEAIIGYRPNDMIGRSAADFIHPDDLEATRQEMRMARQGRYIRNFETRYIHKNGRPITLAWSGVWSEPEHRHFFIGRDMTDRRLLEEKEREVKETLAAVIDASPVAIVCVALDRTVQVWSRAAEQIFGYRAEETIGQRYKLIPAGKEAEFEELFERALAGETFREKHVQRQRKDGTLVDISFSGAAMYGPEGVTGVAYALTDITERNKLEGQLRQAQKMEAIGQLTGGIAHDFNNMLTVITGTIDILADAVADKPEVAAIAKLISEAADRGAELTGHLLAFARRQPLQPRTADINEIATEAARLVRPALSENVEIAWALDADLWRATVDPGQLVTAILNLAVNARDAMPGGGKLTIETGNVVLDEAYAGAHSEVKAGPYVMIAVSDTGGGIPPEMREKVFDPFFTTKGVGKGTGLGLAMVYGFVKQSGGHIKLYSEEGHGTTFKIYLPRAQDQSDVIAGELPAEDIRGGAETILVVEDDPAVLNSVTVQLQSLGYKTITASNAAEALAIIDRGEEFDLLFTDVVMSGTMNGSRLAQEAVKRRGPLKVLFTSGYTENAIVHHGRLDPGVLLLAKPYRKADLARMVRQALNGGSDGAIAKGIPQNSTARIRGSA